MSGGIVIVAMQVPSEERPTGSLTLLDAEGQYWRIEVTPTHVRVASTHELLSDALPSDAYERPLVSGSPLTEFALIVADPLVTIMEAAL